MLVRSVLSLSVALLLIVVASPVRAEQGLPSQSLLSDMGLTGIVVMSDADAMAIRGFGYSGYGNGGYGNNGYDNKMATAYGYSYAKIQGHGASAYSENGYNASSRRHASGYNNSFAGIVVKHSPKRRRGGNGYGSGHGSMPQPRPQVKKVVVFAGGSSYSSTD